MKLEKLTLLTLTLFYFISCNEKRDIKYTESESGTLKLNKILINQETIVWNTDFQSYLNQIPFLKLPLKFECSKGFVIPKIDMKNGIINKYKPEGAIIIGKIYQDKNETAIIYEYPADILFPEISIFDTNGREIRKVLIFEENKCYKEDGYFVNTSGIITNDYKIKTKTIRCKWNPEIMDSPKDT